MTQPTLFDTGVAGKRCTGCLQTKPPDDFYRQAPSGHQSRCKECTLAKARGDRAERRKARVQPSGPDTITHKHCSRCHLVKTLDKFHNQKDRKDGKQRHCKECSKELIREAWRDPSRRAHQSFLTWRKNIKRLYGMVPADYDRMFARQDGRCAICRKSIEECGNRHAWVHFHIDHDEATGHVRGLLCHQCNLGIGHFRHATDLLIAAIDYLKNPPGP